MLVVLANQLEIDLESALEQTLRKYRVRDAERWERKAQEEERADREE